MIKRRRFIVFYLLLLSYPLFAQSSGKIESISLYEKDLLILGEGRKGPYFLPDSILIKDSEQIFINGKSQPKSSYQMNYIDGEIRFSESVPMGAPIRIIYKILPYQVEKVYAHRPLVRHLFGEPSERTESTIQAGETEPGQDYAARLSKSGSITRGVTVGSNRGLKVNSSLNLNVSGKVAENVEVIAALTDQTTPIQPEGTTQNLNEIDKVYVQIKAPNLSATMGDYYLDFGDSQFARYNRKLQGAMGKAERENFEIVVSGAVSRGKYRSMQFMGQEGNQGPYQLKGDLGQIDIILLAGTERVYIDGTRMVRGESNDYIIDYSTAQVTFTRKRLITADSRIVVDFQYSDEKFRRNLYAVGTKGQLWDGKIKLNTTFLREADDKDNPLDFTISEENLNVLKNAGDDPQGAFVDGSSLVGEGEGRYIKDADGIFRYVGQDSGDYNVSFSDVGEGSGDYGYKGSGIFEYTGENQGRYAPVILLPTAKSHNMLDFDMSIAPVKALNVRGEVALSSLDLNTYSGINDDDNQGVAQNWELRINPDSLKVFGLNVGKIDLVGKLRHIDDQFQDIDRTTEIEYSRRWDLPESTSRGEYVKEFQGILQPLRGFTLGGEYGNIKKGEYFRSNRWQFENSFSRVSLPEYNYKIERIEKKSLAENQNGDWWRQNGNASYRFWKLRPIIGFESETKKENWSDSLSTGFKFNDLTGGLEFQPASKLIASTKFSRRDDKDYTGQDRFVEKSTATTQNIGLKLKQMGAFSASVDYTHREREYADSSLSDTRTDLAEVKATLTPWKRAINATLNYQISNTATAKKERVYIKVSQGDGNYLFDEDLNEYVNDPFGDYILRILTTDEFIPVVELKTSSRLRIEPGRFWGRTTRENKTTIPWMRKVLKSLSSETYVAIEERSQEKDVWGIYLLDFSKFRQPEKTIFGNLQLRQDLFLLERNRNFSLRLRYQSRDEKNNQYLEGGEDRIEREQSARLKAKISNKFSSQSELIQERTARTFISGGRQDRDIYSTQTKIDLSYRPRSPLEFALESRFSWEEDRVYAEPTRVRSYALVPRLNYSLRSKGRLRCEFEWSHVTATPKGRIIPYEMADGRSLGNSVRWDVRFDYQLSRTMRATLSYTGRNEPERDRTIHTGRAQVTAAFR